MEIIYSIFVLLQLLKLYSARCPNSTEVILDPSCHRTYNEACSYTCKTGYQPTNKSDGNYVTCTTSSAWDRPLSSLCEKPKCPATIPHGNISIQYCSREYNKVCRYYSCDSGYVKKANDDAIECNATGHWDWWLKGTSRDFCVSETDLCPGQIKNGRFQFSQTSYAPCGRYEGDMCYFACDVGCKKNSEFYILTCRNKNWGVDMDTLCTDCIQCNRTFPHGSVDMRNCYAGKNCAYMCDSNMLYVINDNITSITCSNVTNTWISSDPSFASTTEDEFCPTRLCSTNIPNGHLLSSCTAEVGSSCRYKCDADFIGDVSEIYCVYDSTFTGEVMTHWNVEDTRQLCTNNNQCPLESIPGGSLDPTCTRNRGDVCSYTCDYGYKPTYLTSNQTTITCNSSSLWNASFSHLCKRITCQSTIPNGYVYCYGDYNEPCDGYSCNAGYQPSVAYPSLTCNYDGEWEWTNPSPLEFCLSENELCPATIPGGYLSFNCHPHEGSSCSYFCNGCKNYTAPYYLTCHNKTWDADIRHLCTECTTTTTGVPIRCPSFILNGELFSSCDRTPGTWCHYYCNSGCTKQHFTLVCNSYGEWESGNSACTCPKCHYYIPNGYIPGSNYDFSICDYKPGSTCHVKCDIGCKVEYRSSFCESTGQWSFADNLCYCEESTSSDTDTSEDGSTRSVTIALSVVGVIAFFIIVAGVFKVCRRQCSQPMPQSASASQSCPLQVPHTITSANNTHRMQDGTQTYFNTGCIQEPPPYSEVSFPKEDETTPTTPPLSYEEVTQQTLNTNSVNEVNEHVSTIL